MDLVVACQLPAPAPTSAGEPYASWARWLRPGGVLAMITANPAGPGRFANHTGAIITAAETAGLAYLQHVIAVLAHVEGDRLLIPDDHGASTEPVSARNPVHVPAHADVLIFLAQGAPATGGQA
ncbi:hypothetical protein AB0I53_24350 [Saccharopolyspora sp. NPDC050389]|uniref:hypothetical protein n=1 Tax=Saccharopolyspora sp. NPDC050389 TaxID=3155516 RepID=UPI0033E4B8C1